MIAATVALICMCSTDRL